MSSTLYALSATSPFFRGSLNHPYRTNVFNYAEEPLEAPTERTYGMEIEFNTSVGRPTFCAGMNSIFSDSPTFIVKHDGTIDEDGGEIVTLPTTVRGFDALFDSVERNAAAFHTDGRTGVHIHSLAANNVFAVARLYMLLMSPAFESFNNHLARRSTTRYCRRAEDTVSAHEALDWARGRRIGEHRSAIEFSGKGTLEHRTMASTSVAASLKCYVEYMDAMIEFCVARDNMPDYRPLKAFVDFVNERTTTWPNLADRVNHCTPGVRRSFMSALFNEEQATLFFSKQRLSQFSLNFTVNLPPPTQAQIDDAARPRIGFDPSTGITTLGGILPSEGASRESVISVDELDTATHMVPGRSSAEFWYSLSTPADSLIGDASVFYAEHSEESRQSARIRGRNIANSDETADAEAFAARQIRERNANATYSGVQFPVRSAGNDVVFDRFMEARLPVARAAAEQIQSNTLSRQARQALLEATRAQESYGSMLLDNAGLVTRLRGAHASLILATSDVRIGVRRSNMFPGPAAVTYGTLRELILTGPLQARARRAASRENGTQEFGILRRDLYELLNQTFGSSGLTSTRGTNFTGRRLHTLLLNYHAPRAFAQIGLTANVVTYGPYYVISAPLAFLA